MSAVECVYDKVFYHNAGSQLFTSVWLLMGTVVIAKAIGGALTYVLDTSRRDIMMNSVNVQALDAKKLLLMDEVRLQIVRIAAF